MQFTRGQEYSPDEITLVLESLTLQGPDEILIAGEGLWQLAENSKGRGFRRPNTYSRTARQLGSSLIQQWVNVCTGPREERKTAEVTLVASDANMGEEGIRAYVEAGARDTAPQHLDEMRLALDMCEQLNETTVAIGN